MSGKTQRYMMIYLMLIVVLSAWGAHNQQLFERHWDLMEDKREWQYRLSDRRLEAATVTSAAAVRAWAHERGMVAYPDVRNELRIAAVAAPELEDLPYSGLEIYTVWR